MKTQHIKVSPDKLAGLLDEYLMSGYNAEIDGDEIVIHPPKARPKAKKPVGSPKVERWSKRERNFGYTRG